MKHESAMYLKRFCVLLAENTIKDVVHAKALCSARDWKQHAHSISTGAQALAANCLSIPRKGRLPSALGFLINKRNIPGMQKTNAKQ
jgi:hypothetical protein